MSTASRAIQELSDAIEGERREWNRVEVRPDDIAAVLSALRDDDLAYEAGREDGLAEAFDAVDRVVSLEYLRLMPIARASRP